MVTTYNIELVPAKLVPFDWSAQGASSLSQNTTTGALQSNAVSGYDVSPAGQTITADEQALVDFAATSSGTTVGFTSQATSSSGPTGLSLTGGAIYSASHPLYPLTLTGGLVFPYNPTISESLNSRYDVTELVHGNENVHTFRNNDNVRITLTECVWTADTWDQAVYTLGVIHFFRSYRMMDFGRGKSGRPPSPMWFSAYGAYLYNAVPVLVERVEFSFPADIDYVGVPNPGTTDYQSQTLTYSTSVSLGFPANLLSQTGDFTWIPVKFTVATISLVVQNRVGYWTNADGKGFDLDQFKAGKLIGVR